MRKIVMVCICITLLLLLPLTSLAAQPRQLVPKNSPSVPTPDNGDPDGPFVGGLDDITDWTNLVNGIGFLFATGGCLMSLLLVDLEQQNDISILLNIVLLPLNIRWGFFAFTEAFDMRDVDGDGC